MEDLLISQYNNDRVNFTPTSNVRTGLTQAMQDLKIEDVLPETDPNLESHHEDVMMDLFDASLDKSTWLDHSIWTERWVESVRLPKVLYTLPNGNIGRKYADLLTHEMKLLSTTADSTSDESYFVTKRSNDQSIKRQSNTYWTAHLGLEGKQIRQVVGGSSEMWQN